MSNHLPGCAADTYPDPGMCFCAEREAFAARHRLSQEDADFVMEQLHREGIPEDQVTPSMLAALLGND